MTTSSKSEGPSQAVPHVPRSRQGRQLSEAKEEKRQGRELSFVTVSTIRICLRRRQRARAYATRPRSMTFRLCSRKSYTQSTFVRQGNSLVLTVAFAHGCRQWAIQTNTVVAHPADRKAVHLRGILPSEHVADQFSQSLSFRW